MTGKASALRNGATMRFFKGFFGAAVVAVAAFLLVSAGTSPADSGHLIAISLIGALATSAAAAIFERHTWGWHHYALAGALGYGGVMFGVFALIGMALAAAFHGSVPIASILFLACITCVIGAVTGAGYRFIAGAKSE
jgi:hypothetical protein